jgi:hypothetical protein
MTEVNDAGQVLGEAIDTALLRMQMPNADRARFWTLVTTELEGFRARGQADAKMVNTLMQGLRKSMVR